MAKNKQRPVTGDGTENAREQQNLGENLRMPKGAKKPKNTSK